MTTWVEQAHADAILSLLAAAPPVSPAMVVHDGAVPALTEADLLRGYVLAYIATTTPSGTSLTDEHDRAVTRAYLHCVGMTAASARATAGRASSALLNVRPTITGRVCFPIRDDGSDSPPRRDESTGKLVMDRLLVVRLESVPG